MTGVGFHDSDQHGSQDLMGFMDDHEEDDIQVLEDKEGYPTPKRKNNNNKNNDSQSLGGYMEDVFPSKNNGSDDGNHGGKAGGHHTAVEGSSSAFDELGGSGMGDSSGSVSNLRERAAKETKKSLVKKENRAVTCLRFLVLAVLMGTAIGVSVATFLYAKSVEKDSFEAEFASVAVTTLRSFVEAVEQSFGSLDAVSSGITSHALRTGEQFPNVTIPDFEIKGGTARTQFGSIFMFWLPLVTDQTRDGYEAYSHQMQAQLFGSYMAEEGLRLYQDAYFGINASETEAAQARAEAQAQAEAEAAQAAEAQAAAAAAAAEEAGTEAGSAAAAHTHEGEEGAHTHDRRGLLRQSSRNKKTRQLQEPQEQEEVGGGAGYYDEVDDDDESAAERQQKLEYIHSRLQEQVDAYYGTTTAQEQEQEQRDLHVAPPDTGLPPFGHPTIHEKIWGLNSWPVNYSDSPSWWEPENTGPYLPMWQLSPTIPFPALINFNFFDYTDLAPALNQSLNSGQAVLSYLQTDHQGSDTEQLIQVFLTLNQYRHRIVDYNADPMTQVNYPVFDSFHPTEKKVTGVLLSAILWRLLLLDILPEHVEGVICVLSNSLNQSVTYQINGRDVEYLGEGDLHEAKYDDMGVSRDISQYIAERASVETSSYTTVELDDTYASYKIHVYPSQTMEDSYVTGDPILYAIVVAFIFVFTSGVFILYDFCVQKRQKKVMSVAVKSSALVTSLFPKSVQDRLFGEVKEDQSTQDHHKETWMNKSHRRGSGRSLRSHKRRSSNGKSGTGDHGAAPKRGGAPKRRKSFVHSLRGNDEFDNEGLDDGGSGHNLMDDTMIDPTKKKPKKKGKVIADKYPETTVFFADLAGFTKWSSSREPEQVFELLEALYGSFDKVAIRRAVFKVETIGDCYMAVTGLPNPQPDHAIRAVKFARDCMMRMDRILNELQDSLGADTLELGFRVGLHSGPVTAGVLRGDKGRFQLFGDTVNTASRMESNGVKGRIHVSQSTADRLPAKWLTAREDKIIAKGKGEMQTYYVDPVYEARSAYSAYSTGGFGSLPSDESKTKNPETENQHNSMESLNNDQQYYDVEQDLYKDSDSVSELGDIGASDLHNLVPGDNTVESFENETSQLPKHARRRATNGSAYTNEAFENEVGSTLTPRETAPAILSGMTFSKFGDSIAKALNLGDEISV